MLVGGYGVDSRRPLQATTRLGGPEGPHPPRPRAPECRPGIGTEALAGLPSRVAASAAEKRDAVRPRGGRAGTRSIPPQSPTYEARSMSLNRRSWSAGGRRMLCALALMAVALAGPWLLPG